VALHTKKLYYRRGSTTEQIDLYTTTAEAGSEYLALRDGSTSVYAGINEINDVDASHIRIFKNSTKAILKKVNLVPENMIIMYDTATSVPDNASIVTALNQRYAFGSSSYGGTGGSATHDHTITLITNIVYTGGLSTSGSNWRNTGHYHSVSHTHTDSNLPLSIDIVATIGGQINVNSIWLTKNASMSDIFSSYTNALNRYLRFNNTYSQFGSSSHAPTISLNTSSSIYLEEDERGLNDSPTVNVAPYSHSHTANHTHPSLTNNQSFINLNIFKLNQSIAFNALPSGTIAFFTSSVMPSGWSRYTLADNRLIKCNSSSIETTGGSTTHTHASSSFTTGASSGSEYKRGSGEYGALNHTHTFNHGHTTATNWMPPYTGIVIGVKS